MREFLDFLYARKHKLEEKLEALNKNQDLPEAGTLQKERIDGVKESLAWIEKAIDLLLLVRGTVL